ncbi:MAG: glycosyltransferase family 2 protein [Clostridiales bacterium]|nr:glycosyltransferase family 2 protein [Clostridiales bacterium]
MKNLVIIPAYNEEGCILNTVQDIIDNAPDFDYVVVNDCSTDNTRKVCRHNNVKFIDLPVNLGIGGAVQTGYRYAYYHGYDTAVQFDGDGQHDAKYLKTMLDKLTESGANMVIGSRFIEKKGFQSNSVRRVGINYFTGLIKLLTGKKITDPTSGLRMVDAKLIKYFAFNYPSDYPEPESAVTILARGNDIIEVPVEMRHRQAGKSSINLRKSIYYMIKVSIAMIIAKMKK